MSKFLVSKLKLLDEYVPGEQPRDKRYIKLNTNESPYPPSSSVIAAITENEIRNLYLYSDPECTALSERFCAVYGVNRENIIFGNGSDEILNFCFAAFFSDERPVIFPDITYGFYKVFGELYNSIYTQIPLCEDLTINTSDYLSNKAGVIIANPNAPTGICISLNRIEKIVIANPDNIVIIDEAYIDFGGQSAYRLCEKYDNLLVVGTFSKSRSLAGARLGFAIGSSEIIADLNKIKFSTNPYNINRLTSACGVAALNDESYYKENCNKIISCRDYTKNELEKLSFSVLNSTANFVFAKHIKLGGEYLYKQLKEKGILVRHFDNERINDFLRITIGTKEQMNCLLDALKEIINGGTMR